MLRLAMIRSGWRGHDSGSPHGQLRMILPHGFAADHDRIAEAAQRLNPPPRFRPR